jgi:MFS family permease
VIWGITLMCHAATTNFTGLMVARFFLGVTESAVAPGFSLLTGMFYKRKEQPSRMAMWFAGNSVANGISGLLAYAIGHAHTNIASWRLLFLVLGSVTCAWGFLLVFLLPDSPSKARFLTPEERMIALHRTLDNRTGVMDEDNYKPYQILEALKDPQAWLLFFYTFSVNIPNGGSTAVSAPL